MYTRQKRSSAVTLTDDCKRANDSWQRSYSKCQSFIEHGNFFVITHFREGGDYFRTFCVCDKCFSFLVRSFQGGGLFLRNHVYFVCVCES